MDVTFRATPDLDLVTEAVVELNRHPIRTLRLVGLALTAVLVVVAVLGPEVVGFSGAGVMLALSIVLPTWFLRQAVSSHRRLSCVDTEYTVGAAGITTRTEYRDITTRWPIVTDVVETPELVLLRLGHSNGLVVLPIAGLDDPTRTRLLGLVQQRGALSDVV